MGIGNKFVERKPGIGSIYNNDLSSLHRLISRLSISRT